MPEQLELAVGKPRAEKARHVARRMIAILAVKRGWVTRADFEVYGISPRQCRAGRRASRGRVIFGRRGFRLLRYATADEIRQCLATFASMKHDLDTQWIQLNNRAHSSLHRRGET